jgi:hypothetical protein
VTLARRSPVAHVPAPRSERVARSVVRVSLTIPGEVNDTPGVYIDPGVAHADARRPFDPASMVRCADYRSHYAAHRRDGNGWTCDRCSEAMA